MIAAGRRPASMPPHAFIAMPIGTQRGSDGKPIDFERIFEELLKPALETAGCRVFRSEEQQRTGEIRAEPFQELLQADLVLADLTLDHPSVWYELGVRHALRARGVILVHGPRPANPLDADGDLRLCYHLKDGAPDPDFLAADREALCALARSTLEAGAQRRQSPVFALLPQLVEPRWQQLLLEGDNEFGAACEQWGSRLQVARAKLRAGDMLVLAGETPTQALWLEAKRHAGNGLLQLRQFHFALEQFEDALRVEPDDAACRHGRIVCLGRLGRLEEAQQAARALVEDRPNDAEALALAGRVELERWISRWRSESAKPEQMREAAKLEHYSLEAAIAPCQQAFTLDPSHHASGIDALTLHLLHKHLGGEVSPTVIANLTGGVLWSAQSAARRAPKDYAPKASYAQLCLLLNSRETIIREFRNSAAAAHGDGFALDSTRETLQLLSDLQFRPEETRAALEIVEREIARLTPPFQPRQVLVFSGHRVDAPTRPKPRFPQTLVPRATAEIERVLDALAAGPEDLALTQGASGGDMIFAEACLARGVRLQMLLPLAEPDFIEASVMPSTEGTAWRERYYAVQKRLRLGDPRIEPLRVMPAALGPTPSGLSVYERCNLWLLHTALSHGPEKTRFVCLWDGGGSDGPGGTRHMVGEVKRRTGQVHWIDTRTLG